MKKKKTKESSKTKSMTFEIKKNKENYNKKLDDTV